MLLGVVSDGGGDKKTGCCAIRVGSDSVKLNSIKAFLLPGKITQLSAGNEAHIRLLIMPESV
jgi:hypothetical protein